MSHGYALVFAPAGVFVMLHRPLAGWSAAVQRLFAAGLEGSGLAKLDGLRRAPAAFDGCSPGALRGRQLSLRAVFVISKLRIALELMALAR